MGIATPKTGQIAFSDLNDGILQTTTTAQLDMNTAAQRMGYGTTAQVSISQLRGCVGLTTSFTFQPASKFTPAYWGASPGLTYNSAGDFINQINENPFNTAADVAYFYGSGFNPPGTGWKGTDVTRVASENTVRNILGVDEFAVNFDPGVIDGSASRSFGFKFG